MHNKAVFIEDEMVSLWPPTAPLRCPDEHRSMQSTKQAAIATFLPLSARGLGFQMQILEFRVKQRTNKHTKTKLNIDC